MAAAAGDGDEPMDGGADADFTERLKLELASFIIPAEIRRSRTADVQRKYALVKLCEDPGICPVVFERSEGRLSLKRRDFDGSFSILATYACTQHLVFKIGFEEVKIFSVCGIGKCVREIPCDACDIGNYAKHVASCHPDFVARTAGPAGEAAGEAVGEGAAGGGSKRGSKRAAVGDAAGAPARAGLSDVAKICAHAAVLASWPPAIFDSLGMEHLIEKLAPGTTIPSAMTVRRYIASDVTATLRLAASELQRALEPTTVTIDGESYRLRTLTELAVDKWTGNGGRNFMISACTRGSFGVETVAELPVKAAGAGAGAGAGGRLVVSRTRNVSTMRPGFGIAAMDQYKPAPGDDDDHDRHLHRQFYNRALTAAGLVREDVLALGADTEGVNYASVYNGTTAHVISEGPPRVTSTLDYRGLTFVPCFAHEANSIGTHCRRAEPMKSMLEAAEAISGFLNASDKRAEPLREVRPMRQMAVSRCDTRLPRMIRLLASCCGIGFARTVKKFFVCALPAYIVCY